MGRSRAKQGKTPNDRNTPKYPIAVASDLSGVSQQQLRRMEESGLISPTRTDGNTRRYSDGDLERIAAASLLADDGVNAAGIRQILELHEQIAHLQAENETLSARLTEVTGPSEGTPEAARNAE